MTYQETIDYLYSQLPMFSRIGSAAYKKDLHNTIELCNALGNPQTKFKSIHIAGTNGKGSTSHMLAAMLQQAGYKTGLYTSPHLKDFRERIKIGDPDGYREVSKTFVVDFVSKTKELSERIEPSFFELTVAMAFEYFAQEAVDIAVIETGLGGRLDSTNIITPVLSVITNIGYDHMNILGDTLEKIAAEKAGIIKPGVPVVIGEYLPETKPVFINKAKETKSPVYFSQDGYIVSNINTSPHQLTCDITSVSNNCSENFTLDLNGLYQLKNLRTVVCAEGVLLQLGYNITEEAEKYALANVKKLTGLHGRWDVISEQPMLVVDVAHNEDGIKHLLWQLSAIGNQFEKLHIVTGMVKDKDIDKVLALLPKEAAYYFTHAHIPRALPAAELKEKAMAYSLHGNVFDDVNDAIEKAKANASPKDMILVCGSVFLAGEVKMPPA